MTERDYKGEKEPNREVKEASSEEGSPAWQRWSKVNSQKIRN